jgi:hypothetical protein
MALVTQCNTFRVAAKDVQLQEEGQLMKMLGVAAAAIAFAPLTMAVAHADTSWNIILNGQELSKGAGGNQVTCGHDPIHIVVGGSNGLFANLTEGTLQVQQISLVDNTGASYLYDPKQTVYHWGGGDAQATQSGNAYKITGHIAPYMSVQGQTQKDATPVPFEFDATCP